MKYLDTRIFVLPLLFIVLLAGCDSTDPDPEGVGEEELITRLAVTLSANGQSVTYEANDPDGDGTNLQIETMVLQSGTTYSGSIAVFDDVNGEDVGEEIADEDDEHQFFFIPGGPAAARLSVVATDQDENGLPVGLSFQLTVAGGGSGTASLQIILSHFDDAPKDGVNRSDETDIDVTFPVTIQ
ncbi:MAG: hypothetical protein COV99_03300 [Bacteroidetes bacterium CG12_big_fil_rev_8_21_14_0_65_60_17]|nr:MAG: hypothetical protein COV99_03300 [Bacteroidetes bacterium CG12_big_fil_rev_8_21_14_0_65_60_17]